MNNYKYFDNQNEDVVLLNEQLIRLKEIFFSSSLYKFSNFEMEEISRIKDILSNEYKELEIENFLVKDIFKFAYDVEEYEVFNTKKINMKNDLQALNFALKSLNLQKNKLLAEYNLSKVVKVGEKISETEEKLDTLHKSIAELHAIVSKIEKDFYVSYLEFLENISNDTIVKSNNGRNINNVDKKILKYFKFNKFIYFVNLLKIENMDKFLEILKLDTEIKNFFGELFADLISGILYVGADN